MIERLEKAINKPVVTSNQARAWKVMRIVGKRMGAKRFGRLFETA